MDNSTVRRRKGPNIVEKEPDPVRKVHRSIGWCKAAGYSWLISLIVFPLIIWLIPSPIDPVAFSLPPRPLWTGALTPNTDLRKASKLFENQILGPESMIMDGDYMYAGTADGKVVEIYKGNLRVLTRLGKEPCGRFDDEYYMDLSSYFKRKLFNLFLHGKFEDEPTCGRPLGMRINKDGYLIVVDAYLGLFKVNVATGDHTVLWPSSEPINGKLPKLLNDLDIGPDGTIYMTDSSTKWDRRHNRWLVLEGETTGRLIAYDPVGNTTRELVSGIGFANGVQITRDKKALLMASTTLAAVYKYHLEGPKKGQLEPFNDNLPGLPDNVRKSSLGGYWVGMAAVRKPAFSLIDFAAPRPWVKTLLTKFLSQEAFLKFIPKYGLLVHLDETGRITMSLHDPDGEKIPSVSEVEDKNGVLYLGSYALPFLSKLYLTDIQ